jgi:hypothetical protein
MSFRTYRSHAVLILPLFKAMSEVLLSSEGKYLDIPHEPLPMLSVLFSAMAFEAAASHKSTACQVIRFETYLYRVGVYQLQLVVLELSRTSRVTLFVL